MEIKKKKAGLEMKFEIKKDSGGKDYGRIIIGAMKSSRLYSKYIAFQELEVLCKYYQITKKDRKKITDAIKDAPLCQDVSREDMYEAVKKMSGMIAMLIRSQEEAVEEWDRQIAEQRQDRMILDWQDLCDMFLPPLSSGFDPGRRNMHDANIPMIIIE